MNTMKWLIKREMWEHKGMLLWAPAVIATLIGALALAAIFLGHNVNFNVNGEGNPTSIGSVTIEGGMRTRIVETMSQAYMVSAMPVLVVLSFLVFFYCLGALHDERRDRSLLFWKSLPVSDFTTVMSKLLLAVVVAPLIALAIGTVLSLVILIAACVMMLAHGTNLFGAMLVAPDLYLTPLRMAGLLPVYILWALPTVGWLLMVSSMARSKVFLWAVGTPLVTALLLLWAEKALNFGFDAGWFVTRVVDRILLGVIPGSWLLFDRANISLQHEVDRLAAPDTIFSASWSTLGGVSVWIGVAAGIAMIAAAVWMRRRREEG
jgi:ABC-2 type transport system permease protein